ncbi:MAG TPA: hypothetical protein VH475_11765, partial [Tepidisphaeraceae bacterium]
VATFPNNGNLGDTFDAIVNSGYPKLNQPVTVRSLTLGGGIIDTTAAFPNAGTNALSVTDGFTFSAGSVQVPVNVPAGATFTLAGTSDGKEFGGAITVGGKVAFSGTNTAFTLRANRHLTLLSFEPTAYVPLDRRLTLSAIPPDPFSQTNPSGKLTNAGLIMGLAGGRLDADNAWWVINGGTIRVTAPFDMTVGQFSNSGLIDLQTSSAVLNLEERAIGTVAGSIALAAGATLNLNQSDAGARLDLDGPSVVSAGGTINLTALNGHVTAPTTLPGVVNIVNNGTSTATLSLDSDLILTGPATVDRYTLQGTGRVTAQNLTLKSSLLSGGAELYVPESGTLNLAAATGGGHRIASGARLRIAGTAQWNPDSGALTAEGTSAARVEVLAGGTLDVRPSAVASLTRSYTISSPDTFASAGLVQVDHASLNVDRNWAFDNSGTVRVTAGSAVTLSGTVTNSGTIELQEGANLLAKGASLPLTINPFQITSTGVLRIGASATATIDTPGSFAQMTNAGLIQLDGAGSKLTLGLHVGLVNSGTLRVNGTAATMSVGSGLTNSGLIQLDGGGATLGSMTSSTPMANSGTIRAGSGGSIQISGAPMTNAGVIDLQSGATLSINGNTADPHKLGFFNRPGALLNVGPSATASFNVTFGNAALANAGTIAVDHGQLSLSQQSGFSNSASVVVTAGLLVVRSGSFTNSGTIDLRSGGGMVRATPAPTSPADSLKLVHDMIVAGANGGTWDGTSGITSASSSADPSTAVGYALASALSPTSFQWRGTTVSGNDVLIRHTKYGDATLDGVVDFNDLVKLAQNYNTSGRHWYQGDFTYDGAVDFNDLVKLAQNYNTALPAEPIPGASAAFERDLAAAFAAVPEPGAVAMACVAGVLVLGARRRRS